MVSILYSEVCPKHILCLTENQSISTRPLLISLTQNSSLGNFACANMQSVDVGDESCIATSGACEETAAVSIGSGSCTGEDGECSFVYGVEIGNNSCKSNLEAPACQLIFGNAPFTAIGDGAVSNTMPCLMFECRYFWCLLTILIFSTIPVPRRSFMFSNIYR